MKVLYPDDVIIVRHIIICENCSQVFTSMSTWLKHRTEMKYFPFNVSKTKRHSHAVSIELYDQNSVHDLLSYVKK